MARLLNEELIARVEAMLSESQRGLETSETRKFMEYVEPARGLAWVFKSKLELAKSRMPCNGSADHLATELMAVEQEVMARVSRIKGEFWGSVAAGLKSVAVEEGGEVCGICLEEMEKGEEVRAMGCMHKYHVACIYEWFKKERNCPTCRFEIGVNDLFVRN